MNVVINKKQKKEIYELCFRDDRSFKENQLFDAQETYNAFRQQELKEKINKYESEGLRVIAPVGNSHVELWSSEKKSNSKTASRKSIRRDSFLRGLL